MAEHKAEPESPPSEEGDTSSLGATVRTLASTLWFPAFFFAGFLVCYLLPFHNPVPHHVDVAVAGPSAGQLEQALEQKSPGAFDIHHVADAGAAHDAVTSREVTAGYAPDAKHPQLFVAKADGYSLESVLQKTFTSVAEHDGGRLQVHEAAPTAPGDGMGTGLFYLVLACTIPSYISVMMLLRATTFGRRKKVLTLVSVGVVESLVAFFVARAMDVIPNEPLAIPFIFLMTQAVALTSYGLVPFFKQFFPGVAMGLFVLLSMPSSGGAIPVQMVPGFFRALHPIMPMGNLIEALRGLFYFDGKDVGRHVLVICAWVVAGIALIALGAWKERREARKETEGAQAQAEVPAEPPVEDPSFELPQPCAVLPHPHRLLQQQPTLKGRVTDERGQPLRGVAITVTGTHGRELLRASTDEQGEYAATGLPDHFVNVIASGPDRLAAVARVQARDGHPVRQDFRLAPRPTPAGVGARTAQG
ncbi:MULTISPECIES: carboxypeptidase regulatory-like domain-containing protein [unclassified Streptomyces]|uniref:carboxypeptidase regulatory-like domain-containing protein n=1 Tax=unclassified Streptomyces TaxID=2593676 RepID=UPI002DD919A2|nr:MULTISPECIES: carboxypeptidase regulatory-like domain-containing protein [unclassified Streptomyces]WSA91029.1 carboxypeptidase regulatory-like domain-containing protein [Streptomyces sp. NBC_01795]WSS16364.1 carboxypeptidase regulatory-like domain-containing protein [Streptomyces sp. NBC_01186]WSS45181.1 carboxypeptidase regulatory-like domain-containing protein [Streptomyces sp. NBC_01187]